MRRNAWALWLANKTFKDPQAYIPPSKYPMIHRARARRVRCEGWIEGRSDLRIRRACSVDFKSLECKARDARDCLTARQVQSAQTIISVHRQIQRARCYFPRLEPGTELRWARLAGGPDPAELFSISFAISSTRMPTGTGAGSISIAMRQRRMP